MNALRKEHELKFRHWLRAMAIFITFRLVILIFQSIVNVSLKLHKIESDSLTCNLLTNIFLLFSPTGPLLCVPPAHAYHLVSPSHTKRLCVAGSLLQLPGTK